MKIKIQIGAALLCAIAACLSMSAVAADAGEIQVKDFMFTPTTLTVSAGAKVT
jgi:plastocyanin